MAGQIMHRHRQKKKLTSKVSSSWWKHDKQSLFFARLWTLGLVTIVIFVSRGICRVSRPPTSQNGGAEKGARCSIHNVNFSLFLY